MRHDPLVDQKGSVIIAQKHSRNQIWGNIATWYRRNDIVPGTVVIVRYDPRESHGDYRVVHLIREQPDVGAPSSTDKPTPATDDSSAVAQLPQSVQRPRDPAPTLTRLIARARRQGRLNALEMYLLAVIAYELESHAEAVMLLDSAIAGRLADEYRSKAENLRHVCAVKAESDRQVRIRARADQFSVEFMRLLGSGTPSTESKRFRALLQETVIQLIEDAKAAGIDPATLFARWDANTSS